MVYEILVCIFLIALHPENGLWNEYWYPGYACQQFLSVDFKDLFNAMFWSYTDVFAIFVNRNFDQNWTYQPL